MPSTDHEVPLLLLRASPMTLAALMRSAFGIETGALEEASASFSEIEPSVYTADLVLEGEEAAVVVEVQLAPREQKRRAWPLYTASKHAERGKATWLVVITLDRGVAAWARGPIRTFQGGAFAPLVIGPDEVPRVVDVEAAVRAPELAVLSALAHRGEDGLERVAEAGLAAADAVGRSDEDRGKLYLDAVIDALGEVAKRVLEATMRPDGYEYKSDFARRYVAEGRELGREEGARSALCTALRSLASALDLEWTAEREQRIAALDVAALTELHARIARERRWPD